MLGFGASPALAQDGQDPVSTPEAPAAPAAPVAPTGANPADPAPAGQPNAAAASAPAAEQPAGAEGSASPASPAPAAPDPSPAQPTETETAPAPPYLRWQAVDGAGSSVAGTAFAVQGPADPAAPDADAAARWAGSLTATIADNAGQAEYAGSDLDPRPGWFLVKTVVQDGDPASTHDVADAEQYRVRAATAPDGIAVGEAAEWAGASSLAAPVADADVQRIALAPSAQASPEPAARASAEAQSAAVAVLTAGTPDGGDPPYVFWKVESTAGGPVGGGVFGFAYRSGGGWSQNASVADCVSAPNPCAANSLDRDPDPGEFLLTHRAAPLNSTNRLTAGTNYRLQQSTQPSGHTWTVSSPNTKYIGTSSGGSGTWNAQNGPSTHGFGTFQVTPPLTTKDIVVRKRVFAEPSAVGGSVAGNIGSDAGSTAGSVFRLYENASGSPGAATGFTCTVATGGQCTITVTGTESGGQNRDKRYWVVEEAPVAGSPAASTYANPDLYLGSYEGPTERRRLVGLTPQMTASTDATYMPLTASGVSGGTTMMTGESGSSSVAEAASFGAVVNSYANPTIDPKCEVSPLRIALVLDQSASVTSGQWTTFRNALVNGNDSVLGLLRSADARVSILGFGTGVSNPNGWHFGASGPQQLPANYSTLIPENRPGGSSNATNWDAALSAVQGVNSPTRQYDMVLFVTDGAPNYILAGSSVDSYNVTLRSLEAPIYASNAMKAAGTRVVAVGVGNGASGNAVAANLRAVSGTNQAAAGQPDFVQGDWSQVKSMLTDIVKAATCTIPIEVSKKEISAGGAVVDYAAGWTFTASKTGAGSTLSTPAAQTTTAGANGTAKWDLRFSQPSGQSASLAVAETPKPGWTLTSVQCTVGGQQRPVTVTDGSISIAGLTTSSGKVACTFTNTETPPAATVELRKTWVVKDQTGATVETYRLGGDDATPSVPGWLVASPTLAPAPAPAPGPAGLQWGTVYSGYQQNAAVKVGETASLGAAAPPGCAITAKQLTSGPGITAPVDVLNGPRETALRAGANVFGLTNTVTCTTRLTLLKEVDLSQAPTSGLQPSDWKLTAASGGATPLDGVAGATSPSASNTADVAAGTGYRLTEAPVDGRLAYTQLGIQKCRTVTGTGAGATCAEWETGYLSGDTVSVGIGQHGIYRFVNQPLPPIEVPLTGGMSADLFGAWGSGLALLAALLGTAYAVRIRRRGEAR